ncbi:MAG: 1-acyl-sn-glycerol-3-phosphate acyltransferase [Chitinophagaceae bacterium]|nr:1-acyl-sn-glycerol-3-phosphate acyltransferase [Chitinophagaceae bacterium]
MQQTPKKNSSVFIDIFARVWAFWGLITFVITFLIIFLPSMASYLFPQKKGQDYFIAVSRWWMRVWLLLIGCPARIYGREHFKEGQNYVVVFNHNALLDVPLSAPYIPGGNKTIAKSSFAKVPVFGLFYKRGSVLVDRSSNQSRLKSFEEMKKVLQQGMHICLYPEGTRNRTAAPLKPFYDGAFKLSIESKKDIIPCIIYGTKQAMPIDKSFFLLPTRLTMTFLPPVSSDGADAKGLKEKVFNIMQDKYLDLEK